MTTKRLMGVQWLFAGAMYTATIIGCAQVLEVDKEFVLTGGGPNAGSGGNGGAAGADVIVCGNGELEAGEACDDGNNADKDGCTKCLVDECFTCTVTPGQLSSCYVVGSGTPCQTNNVCDASGKCVECVNETQCASGFCHQNVCSKCDDGMKNGDEADIDCGGSMCPTKCANGKTCGAGTDCISTFCADGVCCDDVCDWVCNSCGLMGKLGQCSTIPIYGEDQNYGSGESCTAAEGEACSGGPLCLNALGQMCTSNAQCASGKCADPTVSGTKTCVKSTGESCTANGECFNNMCDLGTMKCL